VTTLVIALVLFGLAGLAAYGYLRASRIDTSGDERAAIVFGTALALLLQPASAVELAAELVALIAIVLGVASITHVADVTLGERRAQPQPASR